MKTSVPKQPPLASEGGWGWIAIISAFVIHIITTGYMLSISIYIVEWQIFFSDHSVQQIGLVGVILGFLGPVMGLPAGGLSKTFGCRPVTIFGGLVFSLSMLLSMFATKVYHLYLTTILACVGIGFCYQAAVYVIGQYFQRKLGMANGLAMSGVGAGMLVVPPFQQFLIDKYTWQKSYLIMAAISLILIICGLLLRPSPRELYYLKEKAKHKHLKEEEVFEVGDEEKPAATPRETSKKSNPLYYYMWRCIKFFGINLIWHKPTINFIFLSFSTLGFGFYSSIVFFASKAVFDLGIEQSTASWLISIVGIGSFIGRLSHGFLLDLNIISPMLLYMSAALICCLADILNPFAMSFTALAVSAFLLGIGSGIAITVTIVCLRQTVQPAYVSNAWGLTMSSFGTGNLVGVYLMAYLYDKLGSYNVSFFVAASALFISALSMLTLHIVTVREKRRKARNINDDTEKVDALKAEDM